MAKIYCPQCNGQLQLQPGQRIAVCQNCRHEVVVPRGYTELESSFNYAAEARLRRDFNSAVQAYAEILKSHPRSAAAYWGRALSRYGVEYQPIDSNQYRLVCHQATNKTFAEDADVIQALELAEGEERIRYLVETDRITELQKDVARHAAVTAPYDVMIEANAASLEAMDLAEQIRRALNASGLRALCPALEMQNVPRQEWEPMLYHGFSTATVMVYVAVGPEDFSADMVFDAERYLTIKAQAQREAASQVPRLILAFSGLNEYEDIPDSLFDGADERMNMSASDAVSALCDLVGNTGVDYQNVLRKEAAGNNNYEYTNLLSQAKLNLEAGDFDNAMQKYNSILDFNPTESQAYWGLLLAEFGCRNEEELIQKGQPLLENSNYKSALAFANERERQTYQQAATKTDEMAEVYRHRKEEQRRRQQQENEERAAAEHELETARQRKAEQEQRAKQKGKMILAIFAVIVVIVGIGVGLAYRNYAKTTGVLEERYQEAISLYNQKNYYKAASAFANLEDYRDSVNMHEQAISMGRTQEFYELKGKWRRAGESLSETVKEMKSILNYVPEAQQVLDDWLADGWEEFEQGNYMEAYRILACFGEEIPNLQEWCRELQNACLVSVAAYDRLAIIDKETGKVASVNCYDLSFEDGEARSVSLSPDGISAVVVRADGTAYVTGFREDEADVSKWSNMVSAKMSDDIAAGLTVDGVLYSSSKGRLAEDIVSYAVYGKDVLGVRSDGTIYHSVQKIEEALNQWTGVVAVGESAVMGDRIVHAILEGNRYMRGGFDGAEMIREKELMGSGARSLIVGFNGCLIIDCYNGTREYSGNEYEAGGSGFFGTYFRYPVLVDLDGTITAEDSTNTALIEFIQNHKVYIPSYSGQ